MGLGYHRIPFLPEMLPLAVKVSIKCIEFSRANIKLAFTLFKDGFKFAEFALAFHCGLLTCRQGRFPFGKLIEDIGFQFSLGCIFHLRHPTGNAFLNEPSAKSLLGHETVVQPVRILPYAGKLFKQPGVFFSRHIAWFFY